MNPIFDVYSGTVESARRFEAADDSGVMSG